MYLKIIEEKYFVEEIDNDTFDNILFLLLFLNLKDDLDKLKPQ